MYTRRPPDAIRDYGHFSALVAAHPDAALHGVLTMLEVASDENNDKYCGECKSLLKWDAAMDKNILTVLENISKDPEYRGLKVSRLAEEIVQEAKSVMIRDRR